MKKSIRIKNYGLRRLPMGNNIVNVRCPATIPYSEKAEQICKAFKLHFEILDEKGSVIEEVNGIKNKKPVKKAAKIEKPKEIKLEDKKESKQERKEELKIEETKEVKQEDKKEELKIEETKEVKEAKVEDKKETKKKRTKKSKK